jgi:plasmid stabilization system protein ParE
VVVRLHPEALAEDAEVVGFYEEQATGLGREFFDEVQRVLGVIEDNPRLGSPFDDPFRRAYCRRFPFAVIYREDQDNEVLWVQAVMHLRRGPGYWKSRG